MKLHKLYLSLAAGALSVVPVVAAEAPAAKAEAKPAVKAEAPKVDLWSKIPEVVATVDGKPVTKAEFVAFVKSQLPNGELPPKVTPDQVAAAAPAMVREMIAERLFKADAAARKPKITKEDARKFMQDEFKKMPPQQREMFAQMLKQQNKTIEQHIESLISRPEALEQVAQNIFMKTEVFKNTAVTDEEAKKFYDENISNVPEVVEASHILALVKPEATEAEKKAALEKINRIAEEVKKNPADFEKIAAKESDCPSKKDGGRLGAFPRGSMDPEFEKVAFALKQGEISGVVKSQFGYHVIRCDATLHRLPFEKLKGRIRQILSGQKTEQAIGRYIDGLMKQHKVEILVKAPEAPAPAAPAPEKAAK